MFFIFFLFFINRFLIKQKLYCLNFDEHINGSNYRSIYDYNKLDNSTNNYPFQSIQLFDYFNVTEHALKYGAYTNHLPNHNYNNNNKNKNKQLKKNKYKKKQEKKYINNFLNTFKDHNKNTTNNDKPLVFLVSPNQLHYYKVYNKTINKNKNHNFVNYTKNNNETKLPNDFNDDDFFIWF